MINVKIKEKNVKRRKFTTWLFKKNQIKENKLPSKYELQEIVKPCSKSDDDFEDSDDFYDDVNFDAKLYVNRR